MLTGRIQAVVCQSSDSGAPSSVPMRKSGPMGLIVASMLGIIVWLIFILLFALYWSSHFSLFQNVVVFIVSLAITALVIGMIWIILGPRRYRHWDWGDW